MTSENRLQHIAIILDGNRRFAKRLGLKPWKGHEYGKDKVENLLDWAAEFSVKELTLYALSSENLRNRPKKELDMILNIFRDAFGSLKREKIEKNKIKIRFIGHLHLLPKDLQKQCRQLEKETSKNEKYTINFAIAYSGRQEIIDAVKKILKKKLKPSKINEKLFSQSLYINNEPDLIIRTGGEKRLSNFLPWQSTYSEFIFLDKMWPEFGKEDLKNCIKEYYNRKRRFGK